MQFKKKLWIGILILTLISPVGIILPAIFNAGDAWGEWSAETIENLAGFVPEKLKETAEIWKAPVPDYNLGTEESPLYVQILSYIFSGVLGISAIVLIVIGIKKLIIKE